MAGRLAAAGLAAGAMLGVASPAASVGATQAPLVRPDVPVTAVDSRHGDTARNSPALATDPTDARFLAIADRVDGPVYGCELQLSGDSGATWVSAQPVPRLPSGAQQCYAPEVAFDPTGVLEYLFVGLSGPGHTPMGAFLTSSADRGRTFSSPHQVLGARNFQVRMVIDQHQGSRGRMHLVWLHAAGELSLGGLPPVANPILTMHSDDGGMSFSAPVRVSDPQRQRSVAPSVAVGADHAVHVLYYDLGEDAVDYQGLEGGIFDGSWSLVLSTSHSGGEVFDRSTVVDTEVVPAERVMLIYTMPPPALVADDRGRVYAAWHDARNGDSDVLLRRSEDGGRSWSPPLRVNDDPRRDGRRHYLPHLAESPEGRLDAVFFDRRDDPGNLRNHVYYTFSTDGGRSFAPNVRLTTESSSSLIGQMYAVPSARGLVEMGSQLALISMGGSALAAWSDTRNSLGGDVPRPGYIEQAIFAARVDLPQAAPSGGSAGGWAAAWLVVVVVGAALAGLGARPIIRRLARSAGRA